MDPLLQLKKITSLIVIAAPLAWFGLMPIALAVVPAPDGGYPGGNTAEGQNALLSLNVNMGTNNTAVGWFSLKSNVEGQFNTALGAGTLFNNTASRNTAIGGAAMFSNTGGSFNTAVGMLSLFTNSTGSSNTAVGDGALLNNSTGSQNTAVGRVALLSNTTGSGNVATGHQALVSNMTGDQNTAYGHQALLDNTTEDSHTAVGFRALSSNTFGSQNTATGAGALPDNTTGSDNTAIGFHALFTNTTGDNNTANGSGAGTGITGSGNVCIGESVFGEPGVNDTTWIRNVYFSAATARAVYVNSSNKVGTLSSSRRYKDEIRPMAQASEAILSLKPVSFRYKKEVDPTRSLSFGLIAEEVAQVDPDLVTTDRNGKPETVRYEAINAMLLNEFLKAHRTVQELKSAAARQEAKAAKQEATIAHQQNQIEALTAGLQKVSAELEASKPAPQVVNNP